jgi:hypothetical protein
MMNRRNPRKKQLHKMLPVGVMAAFIIQLAGCSANKYPGFEHKHQSRDEFVQQAGNIMESSTNSNISILSDIRRVCTLGNELTGFVWVWGDPGYSTAFVGEPWEVELIMTALPSFLVLSNHGQVLPAQASDRSEWRKTAPKAAPNIEIELTPQPRTRPPRPNFRIAPQRKIDLPPKRTRDRNLVHYRIVRS